MKRLLQYIAIVSLLLSTKVFGVSLLGSENITVTAGVPSATVSPTTGTTRLVLAVGYAQYDGVITGITIGGVALTQKVQVQNCSNNCANSEIWELDTPSTAAMQTLVVTSSATWKDFAVTTYYVSGAGTIVTTNTDQHTAATNVNAAVTCVVGDIVIAVGAADRGPGAFSGVWANSFSQDLYFGVNGQASTAHKVAASTTETANIQMADGSASYSATLAVLVIPSSTTVVKTTRRPFWLN